VSTGRRERVNPLAVDGVVTQDGAVAEHRVETFSRDGLVFDVTDTGPLDGPVAVLLHGFPAHRGCWRAVAERLNAEGVRTVAPDQRGYSPGARPLRRVDYRQSALLDDAVALITAVGAPRVHVVGHDWGGFVAWRLRAAVPHLLSGVTVLSTPHPRAMVRSLVSSAQLARSGYIGLFQVPAVPERVLLPRLDELLRASGLPAEHAADYARFHSAPGALTGALAWYRGSWLPDRRRPSDHATSTPTTYVWGSGDQALGRRAAELTARYGGPDYSFVETRGGHWLPETRADEVAGAVLEAIAAR
jgi:pimeloyl-ACP methyl ester carboxylesterase